VTPPEDLVTMLCDPPVSPAVTSEAPSDLTFDTVVRERGDRSAATPLDGSAAAVA
jgi:hypothetical protein